MMRDAADETHKVNELFLELSCGFEDRRSL